MASQVKYGAAATRVIGCACGGCAWQHIAYPEQLRLKTALVEQALGYAGKANGGILQFSVPRMEKISDSGMDVPPAMGTATAINFQPTGQGKAAISGDFVLLATEVNPVLRALRTHGIEVEAMHNHTTYDGTLIT